jgi:hypothetical protein
MTDAELQAAYQESVRLDALYAAADAHDRANGAYEVTYEYWIDTDGSFLLWEGLTIEEAQTLNDLSKKLKSGGWNATGWNETEGEQS